MTLNDGRYTNQRNQLIFIFTLLKQSICKDIYNYLLKIDLLLIINLLLCIHNYF